MGSGITANNQRPSDYTVALIYVYAFLWVSLAIYLAAFAVETDPVAVHVTTAVLLVAILLHLLASAASSSVSSFGSFAAILVLTLPTALLLLHRTDAPHLYFSYLALHATIAAYVVDVYAADASTVPRWLAAVQVAYLVILGLDTLGRMFPTLLYPAADLQFLTTLHRLADIRLLLLFPIIVAWVVIAILRSRKDGFFEHVPVVWRTDLSVLFALLHVPTRFAVALGTFLAIVTRRIARDFLYAFRLHALHLAKYITTVAAAAAMLLGARAFAPWLIKYLRTPTTPEDFLEPTHIALVTVTPLVGFAVFLVVPFLNSALAAMWRPELALPRLRQRAYQIAVVAAVPCALIGPVFWLGSKWFDVPGFAQFGVVSFAVLALVVIMLMFGTRIRAIQVPSPTEADLLTVEGRRRDWRRGLPVALVGAAFMSLVLLVGYAPEFFGEPGQLRLPTAPPTARQSAQRQTLPPDTSLSDQQAVIMQTIRRSQWRYYWVDVGDGVAALEVVVANAAGVDMYTRAGTKPDLADYACRAEGTDIKKCITETPLRARWWIALNGLVDSAAPTITARLQYRVQGTVGRSNTLVSATPTTPSAIAAVSPPLQTTSDETGRYVLSGLTAGSYAVVPTKNECTFRPSAVSVTVGPNVSAADFTPSCSYTELANGTSVTGERVAYRAWRYYVIVVPEGAATLRISVTGNTDIDLYTNIGAKPTSARNNCSRTSGASTERCNHQSPTPGAWWIGVYGYSAAATYTISSTYEARRAPSN